MKILAVIPARGGSKGIPGKNIRYFSGKPLIAYIIETVISVTSIDRVIVSTDDNKIAEISKIYGAEIPFIRPAYIADDKTPTLPVIKHALETLQKSEGYRPDAVLLIYPTSPLLSEERITEAINMLKSGDYDSVVSVYEDKGHFWKKDDGKFERFYPKEIKNRQYSKPLLKENGSIYLSKIEIHQDKDDIVGDNVGLLIMDKKESVDIDDMIDFQFAEYLMSTKNAIKE